MGSAIRREPSPGQTALPWRHVLGYSLGLLGVNVSFAMVSNFLPYFYTDVFLLSPAIMAILFTSCRIWDGVNDPLMGIIVDSTKSRWGRFRPYLLLTPVPMMIVFALTFYVPDLSVGAKIVWAFVTYFSLQMLKTAMAIPYHSLPAVMTNSTQERTKISGIQQFFGSTTFLLVGVGVLPLVHSFSSEKEGFFKTALILGLPASLALWTAFVSTKKYDKRSSYSKSDQPQQQYSLKQKLSFLFRNGSLMKLMIPIVLYFIVLAVLLSTAIYFYKYNVRAMAQFPVFMGFIIFSTMVGAPLAPIVAKKFGKLPTLHATNLLSILGFATALLITWQASEEAVKASWQIGGISFFAITLACFFGSFQQVLFPSMVLDCIEYGEWKTGTRMEGLINSTYLMANKGGMALGGLIVGVGLSIVDYVPNQKDYSNKVLMGIALIFLLVPMVCRVLTSLALLFYDLNEEKHAEILSKLAHKYQMDLEKN